ncbi:hypothetical protein QQF64_014266 [Cirrhinus molitorella]|uniref:Uncharacterized protein n=1 Tax=Cirrhinus molitorella TaxID=172907 RepID=A0ABR3NSU3_9TELE
MNSHEHPQVQDEHDYDQPPEFRGPLEDKSPETDRKLQRCSSHYGQQHCCQCPRWTSRDHSRSRTHYSKWRGMGLNISAQNNLPLDLLLKGASFRQLESLQVKLQEAIEYDDLQGDSGRRTIALNLKKSDRYSHGPIPLQSQHYSSSQDIINSISIIQHEMRNYKPRLTQVMSSSAASSAITALSPGGLLMQSGGQQTINRETINTSNSELKHFIQAVGELLRHFWSCFPVNTPFLEEKVVKMKSNLERFQLTKLRPFQEKIQRQYLSTNVRPRPLHLL